MAGAFDALRQGDAERAEAMAEPYGYEVLELSAPQGRVLALAERRGPSDGRRNAWGLYLVAPDAPSAVVVEVPHPLHDEGTERIGAELFEQAGARYLFVAGAHRLAVSGGVADVAHQEASVFEALHRRAVDGGGPVVQPHGFSGWSRPPGYGDVVLSSGTPQPGPLVSAAAASISAAGVPVSIYDGRDVRTLGGAANVQAASSRAAGVLFLHVELSDRVRSDPGLRRRVTAALAAAIR